jgi:heme-degrading monooxygenase HmoA
MSSNFNYKPPYYAVIFTSQRTSVDDNYAHTSDHLDQHAKQYSGFLGIQSVRDANGFGISVSYWKTLDDIAQWKSDLKHIAAKQKGKKDWYSYYNIRISKVEEERNFIKQESEEIKAL